MKELLQVWFDTSQHGVAFLEPVRDDCGEITDFQYQLVNTAFADLLRQPLERFAGQRVVKILPGDDEIFRPLVHVVQTGQPQQLYRCHQWDGEETWLDFTLTRIGDQIMVDVQDVSKQLKTKHELGRRLAIESTISGISSQFLTLCLTRIDDYIIDALEQVGSHVGAGRVSVFRYSSDCREGNCLYEWCASHVQSLKNSAQNIPTSIFAWLHHQLSNGQIIRLKADILPPEANQERALFELLGVNSVIIVPLILEKKTHGFIAFYAMARPQIWNHDDESLLETFSTLIVNVLHRKQQEMAIRRASQRLEGLHAIDQALLNSRLADRPPLLIAMKYVHFMVPCERIIVFQLNETTGRAEAKGQVIEDELDLNPGISVAAQSFAEQCLLRDELWLCADLQPNAVEFATELGLYEQGIRSLVVVPLYSKQKCIGAFALGSTVPSFFTDEYQQIVEEVSSQFAVVLYQQQQDERLKQYTDQLEQWVDERTKEIKRLSTLQQAILKHAGQAIISTDIKGTIETANQASEQLLGYPVSELIGRSAHIEIELADNSVPFVTFQHVDTARPVSTVFADTIATRGYLNCECITVTKDGRQQPILLTVSALHDDSEVVIGYVGIATNISALKTAETKLKNLNQRLQLATQAAGQGVWEVDMESGRLLLDERMWEIYGMERLQSELGFDEFLKLIHPDDLDGFMERYKSNMMGNTISNVARIIRPDGTVRWVKAAGKLIRNHEGEITRQIGVTWDITESKLAEEALQESEQRFREIADNVDEVFWIHSAKPFRLLYVNSAYERVWHLSIQQMYENPASFLELFVEEDKPAVMDHLAQYKAGIEGELYCRLIGQEDTIRWIHIRTFNVYDASGVLVRHIGIANDVTGQKGKELVLQQSLQREQELNQLKSQFVSTASHEFRTPLATIQSSVDLIKLYLDLPPTSTRLSMQKHLGVIEKEIDKFGVLLTDILTIGRIESGKISFNPRWVNIVSICEDIINTHFSQRTDQRTVRLVVQGVANSVFLDDKLISHTIVNLLSNAFKFSGDAPCLHILFAKRELVLQVVDTGIGIPARDIAALFQPFFRGSNTNGIQGTGLGLVIARQFVEFHGGLLDVQSEERKGTTFTIRIPIDAADIPGHLRAEPTPAGQQYLPLLTA